MKAVQCEICGRDTARLVRRRFDSIYNQIPIRLEAVEMFECDRCGEGVFTPEQASEVDRQVKLAARQLQSLLPPEKILAIRKRCNLTQEEMEKLFGLGQKVVIRWEKGRVLQSKTADLLLRLLDRNPDIIEDIRLIRDSMAAKDTA